MTGDEIKTLTTSILDGLEIDDDLFYDLLNIAKTKLEEERLWQYLKKLNSSNTAVAGNNYTTGYTLPTDFALDYKVLVGLNQEYTPINFEEQHLHRSSSNRYYIDIGNNQFFLTGTVQGGTIYFYYKRFTDDITSATSPVFPARFHPILAYIVAAYYQAGVDSDDVFARMSPENKLAALELKRAMVTWDGNLAVRAQDNQIGVANANLSALPAGYNTWI